MKKHILKCKECFDLLVDYLDGHLTPDTHGKLEEHLESCPPCLHFLESYRTCSEMAQKLRDQEVQIPSEVESRLKSFLQQEIAKES